MKYLVRALSICITIASIYSVSYVDHFIDAWHKSADMLMLILTTCLGLIGVMYSFIEME